MNNIPYLPRPLPNNITSYGYLNDHLDEASIRNLFHMCWTYSVASPEYNKKVWQELEKRLMTEGIKL
jgi:hypothetical protein